MKHIIKLGGDEEGIKEFMGYFLALPLPPGVSLTVTLAPSYIQSQARISSITKPANKRYVGFCDRCNALCESTEPGVGRCKWGICDGAVEYGLPANDRKTV